jgi:hypothetical protein
VGRVIVDRTDEDGAHAVRMDEWVALETVERAALGARVNLFVLSFVYFSFLSPSCKGLALRDLRTAHCRGKRIPFVVVDRPRAGYWFF